MLSIARGEFARQSKKLSNPSIPNLVSNLASMPAAFDRIRTSVDRQGGGDPGLPHLQRPYQLADPAISLQQKRKNAQAGGVAQALHEPGAGARGQVSADWNNRHAGYLTSDPAEPRRTSATVTP